MNAVNDDVLASCPRFIQVRYCVRTQYRTWMNLVEKTLGRLAVHGKTEYEIEAFRPDRLERVSIVDLLARNGQDVACFSCFTVGLEQTRQPL